MSDEGRSALRGRIERLDARAQRVWRSSTGENMIHRLGAADWLSLAALFWAWIGAMLMLTGDPNWGIVAVFAAFLFDKLDGYWARRQGTNSAFGRQIDSFIDIFTYVVSGALLYHVTISPHPVVGTLVGFVVVAFGGLRLVRHNSEGFGTESGTSYYVGTTVVHTYLVILANYFLVSLVGPWNGWLAGATIVLVSPLMTSRYKAYKTDLGHALVAVGGVVAAGLALGFEYGVL
jgi:CDP-diacylglycerol--serine O-phosphatidyltransferase